MYYLVDYENVFEWGLDSIEVLTGADHLIIFYSSANCRIHRYKLNGIQNSGCSLELIQLQCQRRNALDFYIAVKTGQILAANPNAHICIISKDNGYKSIVDYASAYAKSAQVQVAASISQCLSGVETISLDSIDTSDCGFVDISNSDCAETKGFLPDIDESTKSALRKSIIQILSRFGGNVCAGSLCRYLRENSDYATLLDQQTHKVAFLSSMCGKWFEVKGKNGLETFCLKNEFIRRFSDIGLSGKQTEELKKHGINNTIDAMLLSKKDLTKIPRIGERTADKILAAWQE